MYIGYYCWKCSKVCKTEQGLERHVAYMHDNTDDGDISKHEVVIRREDVLNRLRELNKEIENLERQIEKLKLIEKSIKSYQEETT